MELFQIALRPENIYETLFFNIKSVAEFKNVRDFKEAKPDLFEQFIMVAKTKYNLSDYSGRVEDELMLNDIYQDKAVYYPEFSKIVAITYAQPVTTNNGIERNLKKIVDNDEFKVIDTFRNVLQQISSDGVKSNPHYFPTLCGHNIIANDIPLFIKRLFLHRDKFENKQHLLPYILKKHLMSKPWDANTLDVLNLWKFNGVNNTPITTIADFVGLKRNTQLQQMNVLSKFYWNNSDDNHKDALKQIGLESANQTNLTIQLLSELRYL